MPEPADVDYTAFRAWVRTSREAAHDRGLTDEEIVTRAKLGVRTLQRWQKGEIGANGPLAISVYAYADAIGIPRSVPAALLGWTDLGTPAATQVEPETPEVARELARLLRDPGLTADEREHIETTVLAITRAWFKTRRRGAPATKE